MVLWQGDGICFLIRKSLPPHTKKEESKEGRAIFLRNSWICFIFVTFSHNHDTGVVCWLSRAVDTFSQLKFNIPAMISKISLFAYFRPQCSQRWSIPLSGAPCGYSPSLLVSLAGINSTATCFWREKSYLECGSSESGLLEASSGTGPTDGRLPQP